MPRNTAVPRRSAGRRRLVRVTAGCAVLLGLAGYVAVSCVPGGKGLSGCVVRAAGAPADRSADDEGESYTLTADQAANAATIAAVGTTGRMPERAVTIALATALQESALRNIDYGDRDSLGLFQQRPSQGWGTPAQILDPVYSAGKFYEHLAEVPGYSRLPLTEAAQRVQRSGFPQAYAKHEPDATLLAAALTGRSRATLDCAPSQAAAAGPGDAAKVRAELVRDFGDGVLPATEAAGPPGGDTVSVPVARVRESGADAEGADRRGWELAHWAVARAEALRIDRVVFGDRVWRAGEGWRTEREEGADTSGSEVRMRIAQ
ncbi:hypothetical protein [uncultured Streptomyces sp.]|uniref:hypothetical protein n=1 Tax=uncultured Streptomyces sp. TaxID=174707 RepID=UPI002627C09A|nr:hypothetical protein [uncultured Streptomyces sp.]